ncbi:hypothetical protein Vadar_028142 [Vaccinium darrowii]|uniref:Uncharacterized protein n=1 Tax=Vaccinium darrowii TaxID=229202 RepID=A0ACB7Y2S3_9ERIC|nr:hypothetical protein Vadar_028142 [Vaccinium darrowii]
MGDIAVEIFQETLKQLITSAKLGLIIQEKHHLQSLEEEITCLRGFLKVTEKKRNDHPEVMKLVMEIRDLVAEAENIVELFVVHAFKADHGPYSLCEYQDHLSLDLEFVKMGMKTLTAEVKKIYNENMYDINGSAVKQLKHSSIGSGENPNAKEITSRKLTFARHSAKKIAAMGKNESSHEYANQARDGTWPKGRDREVDTSSS